MAQCQFIHLLALVEARRIEDGDVIAAKYRRVGDHRLAHAVGRRLRLLAELRHARLEHCKGDHFLFSILHAQADAGSLRIDHTVDGGRGGRHVRRQDVHAQQRVDEAGFPPVELAHHGQRIGMLAHLLQHGVNRLQFRCLRRNAFDGLAQHRQAGVRLHAQLFDAHPSLRWSRLPDLLRLGGELFAQPAQNAGRFAIFGCEQLCPDLVVCQHIVPMLQGCMLPPQRIDLIHQRLRRQCRVLPHLLKDRADLPSQRATCFLFLRVGQVVRWPGPIFRRRRVQLVAHLAQQSDRFLLPVFRPGAADRHVVHAELVVEHPLVPKA